MQAEVKHWRCVSGTAQKHPVRRFISSPQTDKDATLSQQCTTQRHIQLTRAVSIEIVLVLTWIIRTILVAQIDCRSVLLRTKRRNQSFSWATRNARHGVDVNVVVVGCFVIVVRKTRTSHARTYEHIYIHICTRFAITHVRRFSFSPMICWNMLKRVTTWSVFPAKIAFTSGSQWI